MNTNAMTQVTLHDQDIQFSNRPPTWPGYAVWPDHAVTWILKYPIKETQYLAYAMLKSIINVHQANIFKNYGLILVQNRAKNVPP